MKHERHPEQPNAHLAPIDGSIIAHSLSKELVSNARIEGMIKMAEATLMTDGTETTVNGIPAVVSETSVEVIIPGSVDGSTDGDLPQDQIYYARTARFLPPNSKKDKSAPAALPAVVFSDSSTLPVITPNPNAMRFEQLMNGPALVVDMSQLDPDVDQPKQVAWTIEVLTRLAKTIDAKQASEEAALVIELAAKQRELQAEKQRLQQQHEWKQRQRMATFKRVGGNVLRWGGCVIGGGAVIAGGAFGISKIPIKSSPGFDERLKSFELPGGTVLALDSPAAAPEFSKIAFDDGRLGRNSVPNLTTESDRTTDVTSKIDGELGLSDTYREIILTSSKPGKNCETITVDKVPLDTRLVAWTDFTGPDGISRAAELSVKYEIGKVVTCWTGQERNESDDPRVLVRLRPASAS